MVRALDYHVAADGALVGEAEAGDGMAGGGGEVDGG